ELLVYVNGMLVDKDEGVAHSEASYARDAGGNKIESLSFGNYLMDPAQPAWSTSVASNCASLLASLSDDGCLLDVLGAAPLAAGYVTGRAVNQATGQAWTPSDWMAATASVAGAVRAKVAPAPVYGNGIGNGTAWFDPVAPTSSLAGSLDGVMVESWVRNAKDPISSYGSPTRWKQDVDMLVDAESKGVPMLVVTKVWVNGTQARKEAW